MIYLIIVSGKEGPVGLGDQFDKLKSLQDGELHFQGSYVPGEIVLWHVFVDCVLWFAVAVAFQVVTWRKSNISKSVKAWAKDKCRDNSPVDWW